MAYGARQDDVIARGVAGVYGAVQDRERALHGREQADAGLKCWAEKACQGAGGSVRVPFRGRRLKRWKRRHNNTHAKIRCLGERAMATIKGRRLLRKLRCSTNRITDVVKAVPVLHHASA
ncbi:transposase family protein [Streptomyces phaeochromogenes]